MIELTGRVNCFSVKAFRTLVELLRSFVDWLGRGKRLNRFSIVVLAETQSALDPRTRPGILVLVGTNTKFKWLRFVCPCGCNDVQALNLMESHRPVWQVEMHEDRTVTILPSVLARKCGAHFWIRRNRIYWC